MSGKHGSSNVPSSVRALGVLAAAASPPPPPFEAITSFSSSSSSSPPPSSHHHKALYLCACLTMGVELLVPLFKASVAGSRCLATGRSFSAEGDLKAYFGAFVRHLLRSATAVPVAAGAVAGADGRLPLHVPADAVTAFFTDAVSAALFDANVYPPLATGVVRPLDGLRRSMQPIPIHAAVGTTTTTRRSGRDQQSEEQHHQLFISGRPAATQPLCCLLEGITHIVRCYAIPEGGEPFCATAASGGAARRQHNARQQQQASPTMFGSFRANLSSAKGASSVDGVGGAALGGPSSPTPSLPTDSDLVTAALEKGGEWIVVPPVVTAAANAAAAANSAPSASPGDAASCSSPISYAFASSAYRYDSLEFPVGVLSTMLNAKAGGAESLGSSTTSSSTTATSDAVYRVQRLTIPAVDDDSYNIAQHFNAEVFGFVSAAIAQGGRVLIHCAAGKHRSAAVAAAYLIDLQVPEGVGVGHWHGTSLPPSPQAVVERCYALLKAQRPMAEPTMNYLRQLEGFAAKVLNEVHARNTVAHLTAVQ